MSSQRTASRLDTTRGVLISLWPLIGLLWLIFWVGGWFSWDVAMWGWRLWAVLLLVML